MSEHFETVKHHLLDLGCHIEKEIPEEEIVILNDEDRGIHNLIVDCEYPILVLEQLIMPLGEVCGDVYKKLLQMNRGLIHGAFALNEEGDKLLFRDTLQLDNLDRNEIEGTLNALGLGLVEFGEELLSFKSN